MQSECFSEDTSSHAREVQNNLQNCTIPSQSQRCHDSAQAHGNVKGHSDNNHLAQGRFSQLGMHSVLTCANC